MCPVITRLETHCWFNHVSQIRISRQAFGTQCTSSCKLPWMQVPTWAIEQPPSLPTGLQDECQMWADKAGWDKQLRTNYGRAGNQRNRASAVLWWVQEMVRGALVLWIWGRGYVAGRSRWTCIPSSWVDLVLQLWFTRTDTAILKIRFGNYCVTISISISYSKYYILATQNILAGVILGKCEF